MLGFDRWLTQFELKTIKNREYVFGKPGKTVQKPANRPGFCSLDGSGDMVFLKKCPTVSLYYQIYNLLTNYKETVMKMSFLFC